jgi:hypothetical protein
VTRYEYDVMTDMMWLLYRLDMLEYDKWITLYASRNEMFVFSEFVRKYKKI